MLKSIWVVISSLFISDIIMIKKIGLQKYKRAGKRQRISPVQISDVGTWGSEWVIKSSAKRMWFVASRQYNEIITNVFTLEMIKLL